MEENKELLKKFGLKIKVERTKQGLSQEQLAEMANLNTNTISTIERGVNNARISTVHTLAKALKVPVEELINPTKIDL